MTRKRELTDKQRRFAKGDLVDLNASTGAARLNGGGREQEG